MKSNGKHMTLETSKNLMKRGSKSGKCYKNLAIFRLI